VAKMTDCIMWHKSIRDTGYGQRFFNGKIARAHRAAWIEANGDIPTGLIVDHMCHNEAALKGECEGGKTCKHRACVNVEHLRLITVSENNKAGLLNRDNRKVCPKGMPSTYSQIASTTASGSNSDISFTNIPQIYTNLVLVAFVRGAKSASTCSLLAYVGTGANGTNLLQSNENSVTYMTGDGSSATSTRTTNGSGLQLVTAPAASAASGVYKQYVLHFPQYNNSTTFKSMLARTDLASDSARAIVGLVRTTLPLLTVGIATYGDGNIASGSTFTLYGIKGA